MSAINDIQGKSFVVKGGGTCIYCGSDGANGGLRDEHVIPFALGGKTTLLNASCSDCERITSYLDGYLANQTFKHFRVHAGVQSRSGHAKLLPAEVARTGGGETLSLPVKEHPYFLHMPIWQPPGLMTGSPPSDQFHDPRAHVFWWIPPNISDVLGLSPREIAEIQDKTPMPNVRTFARAIAKVAYCQTIIAYGLDGFRSLALTDIILGRYPCIPFFVGSDRDDPPPPEASNVLHVIHHTDVVYGRLKFITTRIRLFANSGTAQHGMPYYEVVTGVEGKPVTSSLKRIPPAPRVILL